MGVVPLRGVGQVGIVGFVGPAPGVGLHTGVGLQAVPAVGEVCLRPLAAGQRWSCSVPYMEGSGDGARYELWFELLETTHVGGSELRCARW